jgi:hypothetical protein
MNRRHLAALVVFVMPLAVASCTVEGPEGSPPPAAVRTPTFAYAKKTEGGCGDLFFHKGTADQRDWLWISADKKKLKLPAEGSKTFDLKVAPDGLQVAVDLWEKAPRFRPYCNDISAGEKREGTWKATRGKITITIHPAKDAPKGRPDQYRASARLEGVVFADGKGHEATLKQETITDVLVGWYAG